jgi:hypothetical protein
MAITASINGNIQLIDSSSGSVAFKKTLTALSMTGNDFLESNTASAGTGGLSVTLPVSPCLFLYVKNLHASNTLAVSWTPNGGSSAAVITLGPGSSIQFQEVTAANGITALTLTGSAAATTCEYILAG